MNFFFNQTKEEPPEPKYPLTTWTGPKSWTLDKIYKFLSRNGREWLKTDNGKKWLETDIGKKWLNERADIFLRPGDYEFSIKKTWLTTYIGQIWLNTDDGQKWLNSDDGREWLDSDYGKTFILYNKIYNYLVTTNNPFQNSNGKNWLNTEDSIVFFFKLSW